MSATATILACTMLSTAAGLPSWAFGYDRDYYGYGTWPSTRPSFDWTTRPAREETWMVLRPTKAPSTKIPASAWAATADNHLQLQLRLPNIDAETLASELSADGKVLSVSAARKHDGCSCKNTHLFEATLPHTPPRPDEELEITVKQAASGDEEDMVLTVRMPRHTQLPGNGPTSLKITHALPSFGGQAKASTGKQATAEEDASRVQRESNQLDNKFKAVLAARDQPGEEIKPDRSKDATSATSTQGANGTVPDTITNASAAPNNNTPIMSSA